jgi:hypothetical protein
MDKAYNEYNNTWLNVLNNFKNKNITNLNKNDIVFGEYSNLNNNLKHIKKVINNGKITDISENNHIDLWEKSREYTLDVLNNESYDLIIELGSGYGRNIFYYLFEHKNKFQNIEIISGEYTKEGCNAQIYLKEKFFKDSNIQIYRFDYNNSDEFFKNISKQYKNILILTFWSIEQITYINDSFFHNLLNIQSEKLKCINIEPIGWQISDKSLMKEQKTGYRSYYNKNLYLKLKELENKNIIKIKNTILDYFNFNSVESCGSLIEWDKL